jgi:hypothetical protein
MDEGGVLFCSRTEIYFGLNAVGVAIWDRLPEAGAPEGRNFEGLVDALQEVYPDVDRAILATDVQEFLGALEESELIAHGAPEAD